MGGDTPEGLVYVGYTLQFLSNIMHIPCFIRSETREDIRGCVADATCYCCRCCFYRACFGCCLLC